MRKVKGLPLPMQFNEQISSNSEEIFNMFADFFESVYNKPQIISDNSQLTSSRHKFLNIAISSERIYEGLLSLDCNKGAGPDGIPPTVLKECAINLVEPLEYIFNRSLQEGIFPSCWKVSKITPIFKSGKRNNVENYRGISILSATPKFFESLVRDIILFHVRPMLSAYQHGFLPGKSTTTNLVVFSNFVNEAIESGDQVDVVYTDFSKAFDSLDHETLLNKIENLNCEFIPTVWLRSYLSERKQHVRLGDCYSREIEACSGVPQGSHLGPLLFLLFINDIANCFETSSCLLYADDLKIFRRVANNQDEAELQRDLDKLSNWTVLNNLRLNVSKCKVMSFSRNYSTYQSSYSLNNSQLIRVELFKDLGVVFTPSLSFNNHIEVIVSKAVSMLGFIKRITRDFRDPYTLKTLYVAYVRSHLEYASVVWAPYCTIHSIRIESVQRKFLLFALKFLGWTWRNLPPYKVRCEFLGLQFLEKRRSVASAVFAADILTARIDCPELLRLYNLNVPSRNLRHQQLLSLGFHRTNYGNNEPVTCTSRNLNCMQHVFDWDKSRDWFRSKMLLQ